DVQPAGVAAIPAHVAGGVSAGRTAGIRGLRGWTLARPRRRSPPARVHRAVPIRLGGRRAAAVGRARAGTAGRSQAVGQIGGLRTGPAPRAWAGAAALGWF